MLNSKKQRHLMAYTQVATAILRKNLNPNFQMFCNRRAKSCFKQTPALRDSTKMWFESNFCSSCKRFFGEENASIFQEQKITITQLSSLHKLRPQRNKFSSKKSCCHIHFYVAVNTQKCKMLIKLKLLRIMMMHHETGCGNRI